MNTRLFRVSAAFLVVALIAVAAAAQSGVPTSNKFLISAKAGAVNEVVGDVSVERTGRTSRLYKNDAVQETEVVSTGADGKVEILMNPGSYIRLGGNSSFEFDSTSLDDVRVKLHRGSGVFEVVGTENFTVDVTAGNSRFALVDSGIYRIDVGTNGEASVSIWKGKMLPGVNAKKTINSGQKINYGANNFAVAKFDRKATDALMEWSSTRAKALSAVSASLKPSVLRDTLVSSFYNNRWNLYDSFGLWVFNPFYNTYCFLPFGYGWQSPYGYGFGKSLWYYRLPWSIYNAPPPQTTQTPSTTKVSGRPHSQTPTRDAGFANWKRTQDGQSRKMSDGDESAPVRGPQRPVVDTRPDRPTKFEAPPIMSESVFVPQATPTRPQGRQEAVNCGQ